MKLLWLALPLLLLGSAPGTAPDWVLRDGEYRKFLVDLQTAVRSNNRAGVVKLVRLPLRVHDAAGRSRTYRTAKAVEKDFARIFSPAVRKAILRQRFDALFGRDQGVMIGNGEVWFDRSCLDTGCTSLGPARIKAINLPPT